MIIFYRIGPKFFSRSHLWTIWASHFTIEDEAGEQKIPALKMISIPWFRENDKMSTFKICLVTVLYLVTFPCVTQTSPDQLCDANRSNVDSSDAESLNSDAKRRVKREFVPYKSGKTVAGQVSSALDHLLVFSGYDKRIRPQVRFQRQSSLLRKNFIVNLRYSVTNLLNNLRS